MLASLLPIGLAVGLTGCGSDTSTTVCGTGTSEVGGVCTPTKNLRCGSGTYEVMGLCSPFDPNDNQPPVTLFEGPESPSRTQSVGDVHLYTEPGAQIFYTLDGSDPTATSDHEPENVVLPRLSYFDAPITVKYYAVDKAGNKEALNETILRYDVTAPGPVTNLQVTKESDGSATLTWENPTDADFAGVVVYRDGKRGRVIPGTAATAANFVFVGAGATTSDTPDETFIDYQFVTFDDLYNYGQRATVQFDNSPTLLGSVGWEITSAGSVQAGADLGQGISFDIQYVSGTTFEVTATNNTTLMTYHAPKVLFSNIADGSWGDGTVGGETFVRIGTNGVSLAPGQSLTGTFSAVFSGATVAGVQTATADLSFRSDFILVSSKERIGNSESPLLIIDLATFSEIGQMAKDNYQPGRKGGMQGVTSKRGQRYLWAGNRSQGSLRKIDTTTWSTVSVATIGARYNLVGHPFFAGNGGLLWAALSTDYASKIRSDSSGANIGCFLVGVDPSTMQEVRRIKVDDTCHLRNARVIPATNGSKVAIANHRGGVLYIVDLDTSDPALSVRAIRNPRIPASTSLAPTADGDTVYLSANDDASNRNDVAMVTLSTGAVTLLDNQRTIETFRTEIDSTGKVWFVNDRLVTVMDPSDNNSITTDNNSDGDAVLFYNNLVYLISSSTLVETDLSHVVLRTLTGLSQSAKGHNLDLVR